MIVCGANGTSGRLSLLHTGPPTPRTPLTLQQLERLQWPTGHAIGDWVKRAYGWAAPSKFLNTEIAESNQTYFIHDLHQKTVFSISSPELHSADRPLRSTFHLRWRSFGSSLWNRLPGTLREFGRPLNDRCAANESNGLLTSLSFDRSSDVQAFTLMKSVEAVLDKYLNI